MSPVLAVAAGGVVGASCRYGLYEAFPGHWTILVINVVGCLLIGALMPLIDNRPLLRPFVAPGILGGFTTFSAFAVDARFSAVYLGGTVVGALAAVWAGAALTERLKKR
jgi:fluoride exporter